ncbi:hypothetical protein ACFE04_009022 [Oxalis oulophora]
MFNLRPIKHTLNNNSSCYSLTSLLHSSYQLSTTNTITSTILTIKPPIKALQFFNSNSNKINPLHSLEPHSAIIHVLTRAKLYTSARCLIKCLIQDLQRSCTSSRVSSKVYKALSGLKWENSCPKVYSTFIIALSEMGLVEEGLWVCDKLRALPELQACNAILNGLVKAGKFDEMWEVYKGMLFRGFSPSVVTYGVLVSSWCSQEMEKLGILSDGFTYNILIKGFCGVGRMEEAIGLLQKMNNATSVTYNSIIGAYCKEGKMDKAIEVCSKMVENGINPNVITFSTLIDGFCKASNIQAAMGLFSEMIIKGIVPDVVTYTALIDGHCKDGNIKEAFRLHNEMLAANITANVYTNSCLIDGLCKNGRTSEAIKFFLEKTGACENGDVLCSPNHVMYAALIQGLCEDFQLFKASKFFLDMRRYGLFPDLLMYNVMLRGQYQAEHRLDVMMLHADIVKMGLTPNEEMNHILASV